MRMCVYVRARVSCVCETSLGRLTRATERPILGREARNNGERYDWGKEPRDRCRIRIKVSVRFDFLLLFPTRVVARSSAVSTAVLARKQNLFDVF